MGDEPTIVWFPARDTGLGREAGFEDDAALIAAAEAQRSEWLALLTPDMRDRLARAEQNLMDMVLYGNRYETADGERIDPANVSLGIDSPDASR